MHATLWPALWSTFLNFISAATLGVLGWAYILHGRVSRLEGRYEALTCMIKTRFDATDKRLDRIERALNGHLKRE